ncbi:MAG: hypothetical protein RSE41_11085 [Clostridia bacterium]
MKYYYYSTVDDIVLNHSNIIEKNYLETITLHYERDNSNGNIDIAEIVLPNYNFTKIIGFTEDEILELYDYARNNAPLIWELSKEYGEYEVE